jgi:hypothetical protein
MWEEFIGFGVKIERTCILCARDQNARTVIHKELKVITEVVLRLWKYDRVIYRRKL